VSWLDLSGNARIVAPGLRVQIEGKSNRFKRVGRPRSLFAPKSARIARWLLMKRDQAFTQRELARVSGLDEGFTSRIVRGLEEQRLIVREAEGNVRVADYSTLLDAMREAYDFSKHHIVRGHVAARSSDEVLRRLAQSLHREKVEYAATGLAGAWLWSGFAGYFAGSPAVPLSKPANGSRDSNAFGRDSRFKACRLPETSSRRPRRRSRA
jgi:ribosomal protein S28E/S33